MVKLIDHGGPVLTRAKIVVHFRGNGWLTGEFKVPDAQRAFRAVCASPYFSHLPQYRGIRRPQIVSDAYLDHTDIGRLAPDPRKFVPGNVWVISDDDVKNAVRETMFFSPPVLGQDTLYVIAVSQDPVQVAIPEPNANGYHNSFVEAGSRIRYAILFNQSANSFASVGRYLPDVFSHEVVEACTDPDPGTGFGTDVNEMADFGDERPVQLPDLAYEIDLAAYWSELAGETVVPTSYSLRIALGKRRTDVVPSVAALAGTRIRAAIRSTFEP